MVLESQKDPLLNLSLKLRSLTQVLRKALGPLEADRGALRFPPTAKYEGHEVFMGTTGQRYGVRIQHLSHVCMFYVSPQNATLLSKREASAIASLL